MAQTAFRTFVADENGDRHIPCLFQDGRRWKLYWNYLDNGFNGNGRVAFSSNWQ